MIIFDEKKSASTSDLHSPATSPRGLHSLPSNPNFHSRPTTSSATRTALLPPPYANGSSFSAHAQSASTLSLASTSSGPISTSTHFHIPHRSNHLYITRPAGPIKGSWILDTSLKLPAALLPAIEPGTTRKNLRFHAKTGKISARVEVKGNARPTCPPSPDSTSSSLSTDGRAHLIFRSDMSNIKLRLRRTDSPRLNVSCYAPIGSVTVYLPYDFHGPVRTTSSGGLSTLFLSSAIQKRCTPIVPGSPNNAHSRRCVYFIGNCPGPEETWDNHDEVEIDAREGFVKILFVDERKENDHAFVKQVVRNVQNEGVVNYFGRVVSTQLERSREKIAIMSRSPSLTNLSSYGTGKGYGNGKIT